MTKYIYILITLSFFFPQDVGATNFFTDFGVACGGVGTASTTSFCSINDFSNVARAEGDQVWVRRGTSTTTGPNAIAPISDGTINNPIIVSADYDNIWGDFSTSSQTFTLAAGSSTMTASASITGIAAGDWIYVVGDQFETPDSPTIVDKIYSYEVKSVSGTQLTLYFPYNGKQTGSGNSLRVMPDNPIYGVTTVTNWQINLLTDGGWVFNGLEVRSTNNIIELANSGGIEFRDLILTGNGVSVPGFNVAGSANLTMFKTRMFDVTEGFTALANRPVSLEADSILVDCDNNTLAKAFDFSANTEMFNIVKVNNFTVQNCTSGFDMGSAALGSLVTNDLLYSRNSKFLGIASTSQLIFTGNASGMNEAYMEDANGYIGANYFTALRFSTTSLKMTIQKSDVVRNASTYSSSLIMPSPNMSNKRRASMLKLFEYPIYANTTSKTYSVFFNSTSTANWTTDPTASEFWIECEYWAHPVSTGTTTRAVKRSTGVIDFNGSTAWQSLSVACQPTASGILYLRGWYAKPQESGVTNAFYVDVTPEIS